MQAHITTQEIQILMERFLKESPNGDSLEMAEFMFNAGFEAGEQGGFDETNFVDTEDTDLCYQPVRLGEDGVSMFLPDGLFSFQAFRTRKACDDWLLAHGYLYLEFNIEEYHRSDIEGLVLLDA